MKKTGIVKEIMSILVTLYNVWEDMDEAQKDDLLETFYRYKNYHNEVEENYQRCHNRLFLIDDKIKKLENENTKLKTENEEFRFIVKSLMNQQKNEMKDGIEN